MPKETVLWCCWS